jgi:taurine dioxygenase
MGGLRVEPVARHIGADVSGVELAAPLSEEQRAGIWSALLQHKVLFFRDQHLGHAEQVTLGKYFGPLLPGHPYAGDSPAGYPEILTVDKREIELKYGVSYAERYRQDPGFRYGWHTDISPSLAPPAACILRAETVPEFGGDTQWTSLVAAYAGLSAQLRCFVDGLSAEHAYVTAKPLDTRDRYQAQIMERPLSSIHPMVRIHPETGERALYVNPHFTRRIVELSAAESAAVLQLLFEQIARPAYTVRFRWTSGSVAMWDNRATAHLVPTDLDEDSIERRMHRVTIAGDIPVGVDGRSSTALDPHSARPT